MWEQTEFFTLGSFDPGRYTVHVNHVVKEFEITPEQKCQIYENRRLNHEEFRDDRADGGEIGAGHSVTALYEIKLSEGGRGHLVTVSIRYEDPDTRRPSEINEEIFTTQLNKIFEQASPEFQLAATVAEFAEILRESPWAEDGNLAAVSQSLRTIAPRIHNEQVDELRHLVSRATRFKASDIE